MAEPCNKAFGRYLKTLRERRGLSLDDVRSLSQTFPDSINKGYLSRCENGHQRLAFSKLIPLSRIYEVPSDVLVERMELDMELERMGGPDTEGMSYAGLRQAAKDALSDGVVWSAYAYTRDALRFACKDPVLPYYRDCGEQLMIANLNCATVARSLGRYRFSYYETQVVAGSALVGSDYRPLVLERVATSYQMCGQPELAKAAADNAIEAAKIVNLPYPLAFTFATRAEIALQEGDSDSAIESYQRAFEYYKESGENQDCARMLNNLAQIYFNLRKFKTARSALAAARHLLPNCTNRASALGMLLLGEIEELENRPELAVKNWKEAVVIATALGDKTLRFKAEYQLFRHARKCGNAPTMRSIQRRLLRLSPWVPSNIPELVEFKSSLN